MQERAARLEWILEPSTIGTVAIPTVVRSMEGIAKMVEVDKR